MYGQFANFAKWSFMAAPEDDIGRAISSLDLHPDAEDKRRGGTHRVSHHPKPVSNTMTTTPAISDENFPTESLLKAYDAIASEITRRAIEGEKLPVLLERVNTFVTEALYVPFSVVLGYQPEEKSFVLLSAAGWERDVVALFVSPGKAGSTLRKAVNSREAVVLENLETETRCDVSRALAEHGAVSGLCVSIPGAEQAYGLLAVFTKEKRAFGIDEQNFIRSVANLLAMTVATRSSNALSLPGHENIVAAKREWESTVDALPGIVVCLLDKQGHIIRANRAVERWTLGRVDDIKGKSLHQLLHATCDDPQCYLRHFQERSREELALGLTLGIESDDVQLKRFLRIQLRPIYARASRNSSRLDSAAVAVVHDVSEIKRAEKILHNAKKSLEKEVSARTFDLVNANQKLVMEIVERKRIERELWDSHERYRLLIDTMNEGLAVQNVNGELTYVNNHLCHMLGYSHEELLGRPVVEFVAPRCQSKILECLQASDTCLGQHFEIEWVCKDGKRIYTNVSPQPILNPEGGNGGFFAVITDLTDRRNAEEKLRKSENELRLLSAQLLTAQEVERKRIARELHDGIGQSLSALKFCLENSLGLFERYGIEKGMPVLQGLIPKMQQEIEEVRRISMGLRPTTLDDLGIVPTIAWFSREFRAIYRNIHLDTRIDVQEHQVPVQLKTVVYRIMQEALNNVVKHAHADSVRVDLTSTDSAIEIQIADNGQGFDASEFNNHSGSSSGMGLSSMRERAENSGGHISIVSSRNLGTQIKVSWPCHGTA